MKPPLSKEEKIKLLEVKLKQLKADNKKQLRKERARKLIQIGAYFSSIADVDTLYQIIANDKQQHFKDYVAAYLALSNIAPK